MTKPKKENNLRLHSRPKAVLGDPYCYKCGQKCVTTMTGKFDAKTGKQIHKYVCPSGTCLHEGIEHLPYVGYGLLSVISGIVRCPRCGALGHNGI